jgi:hypothetical protein
VALTAKPGGRRAAQWILWAFKLRGCDDCGVKYPEVELAALHCDHRDPSTKNGALGAGGLSAGFGPTGPSNATRFSFEALFEELLKCDVVCQPCHAKRHRERRATLEHEQATLFAGTGEAWRYG